MLKLCVPPKGTKNDCVNSLGFVIGGFQLLDVFPAVQVPASSLPTIYETTFLSQSHEFLHFGGTEHLGEAKKHGHIRNSKMVSHGQ